MRNYGVLGQSLRSAWYGFRDKTNSGFNSYSSMKAKGFLSGYASGKFCQVLMDV